MSKSSDNGKSIYIRKGMVLVSIHVFKVSYNSVVFATQCEQTRKNKNNFSDFPLTSQVFRIDIMNSNKELTCTYCYKTIAMTEMHRMNFIEKTFMVIHILR